MNYIIDFSLVSIAYLSVTAIFYRRQPKVPSLRNSIFAALLFLGVFFALMDVLVVVIEPVAYKLPEWLVLETNAVFLISIQLSSALFLLYCLIMTGYVKGGIRPRTLLFMLPFFITAVLLMLPLGPKGIFYLDEAHVYHRGGMYVLIYIDTALYLLASLALVFLRRGRMAAKKLLCVCAFLGILFVSMLIQFNYPVYLLNAMANALALTLIYHVLEAPSTHVDTLTGVLNRRAFPLVVRDSWEQDRRSTLFILTLSSLGMVNHSFGMLIGDALLSQYSEVLKGVFPRAYIFRPAGDAFAVLMTDGKYCDMERLEEVRASLPDSLRVKQTDIHPEVYLACINSEDTADAEEMLSLSAYVLQLDREGELTPLLLADRSFIAEFHAAETLEKKVDEALTAGRVEVFYQPLHDCGGKLTALEALVRIRDENGAFLPTQEAVELSEKNGSIHALSTLILRKVCQFIRDNDTESWGLHHIGVNLSALQFIRGDLCQSVSAILDEYGVNHSLVAFEITETATASVTDISENMEKMKQAGFSFLLDDFGKGYANFNNLARLPLLCAKIDKLILWEATQSRERMAFLQGIVEMLRTMGLTSVCEGVETKEQLELLSLLGVDMLQGYYFSRPLPPKELLSYVRKEATV